MIRIYLCILFCFAQFNVSAQRDKKRRHAKDDHGIISSSIENHVSTQKRNFHFNIEGQGIVTTSKVVPFWLRANQYGSIPLSGTSFSLLAGLNKSYDVSKKRLFDYGFAFQGRLNEGKISQFILIEGYAKVRLSIFELKAGRSKDFMGLVDSTLSMGAFAQSGNALGIPKIQLSFPDYWTLPWSWKLFAIKGSFSHGWLGDSDVNFGRKKSVTTYFHQKSFYGRFGKPNWRLKLFGGFNHQVLWGSERQVYGPKWSLTPFETYLQVVFGKTTNLNKLGKSKAGDALGSIDFGVQYDFKGFRLSLYRQNIYDVGALYHLANLRDGLNGVSITNKKEGNKDLFRWNKFLFEFFYTKNQAGYPWSKRTPSGDEDYYNNYFYKQGYSYNGIGIGNPFITENTLARSGQARDPTQYFINNRVVAFGIGTDVTIKKINFIMKLSYSKNYGTFATSPYGLSTGDTFNTPAGLFKEVNEFSSYFEGRKELKNGLALSCIAAYDTGGLLYNSTGIIIKAGKVF